VQSNPRVIGDPRPMQQESRQAERREKKAKAGDGRDSTQRGDGRLGGGCWQKKETAPFQLYLALFYCSMANSTSARGRGWRCVVLRALCSPPLARRTVLYIINGNKPSPL
jgi:hypothetical protein